MAPKWIVSVFLILWMSFEQIGSYNFDAEGAVVFSDPNVGFYRKGSFFGYAVAIFADPVDPVVLVGAPRANVSRLFGIREPGAVYYCRLNGKCKEWALHYSRNGPLPGIYGINQIIDGAWIGGTISVENKAHARILVCAPRWKNHIWGTIFMNGMCYYTVANSSAAFEKPVQKFLPEISYPSRQVTEDGMNYFAMGQFGFSLHDFSNEPIWDAMVGAPGCYSWTGTPVVISENKAGTVASLISERFANDTNLNGYSVTSGFYFGDGVRWYVAAAPQTSDLKGKIEIFQYNGNMPFRQVKVVKGTQSGEYFGASVTSCDFNDDGRDEIIVGAPSWSRNVDEGRIYVISTRKNSNGFDITWIDGQSKSSRFGSVVVCLGDLDHDGYPDVAVGAPYETKSGAVYVFNGGRHGLDKVPSQKLLGSDFGGLRGFGFAISEPRDVDSNGYPDIVVGSYKSGHAVLLKSKPVVQLKISLRPVNEARLDSNVTQFLVKFCGSYEGHRVPATLKIISLFQVDLAHHRAKLNAPMNSESAYEITQLLNFGRETCTNIPIIFLTGTKTDPLDISVSSRLIGQAQTVNQDISKTEDSVRLFFNVECGSDNICHSDLSLDVSTSLANNSYVIGEDQAVELFIVAENNGEAAYEAEVHVTLPPGVSLGSKPDNCVYHVEGIVKVICDVGNPLRTRSDLKLKLLMSQVDLDSELQSTIMEVAIHITTQSANINSGGESYNLVINLAVDSALDINGKAVEGIYSYLSSQLYPDLDVIRFTHIYGVQKLGVTPISQAVLYVLVPTHFTNSKNEISEIARINSTILRFTDLENRNDYVCKTERIKENRGSMLSGNSINSTESAVISTNLGLSLTCDNSGIVCVNVTCLMDVPKTSVSLSVIAELTITIDLLLTNFSDDLTNSQNINFVSNGSVMITHPLPSGIMFGTRKNFTSVSTKFLGNSVTGSVDIWIIAVSASIGILLLALLIFALIKIGFFNRKRREDLEVLKAENDGELDLGVENSSSKEFLGEQ